jgi:cysteine desulfuration protein SufE
MDIEQQISILLEDFKPITQWEDRYRLIIQKGKDLAVLPEEFRTDSNKVKGCQSQVWLFASLEGERIQFYADSDASIVKGIIALLLQVYNNQKPEDILKTPHTFLEELGLRQHLSMNRSNGLTAMLKQIQFYALAFKAKLALSQG